MTPEPRLSDVHRAVRGLLGRRATGAAIQWGAVAVLAVLALAWLMAGREGWSRGTGAPLALDVVLLVALLGGGLGFRYFLRRWLAEARVTRSMEDAAGLPSGLVLGALEISREVPAGVSAALAARAEARVLEGLKLPTQALAGRLDHHVARWARQARTGLVMLSSLLVGMAALAPARSASAWKGLGTPLHLLAEPARDPLLVTPGSVEVLRGASVPVSVLAGGRDEVTLHWQAMGDVERRATSPVEGGEARFSLREVRAPMEYWASAGDGTVSAVFHVTPVDPLLVNDMTVGLDFPPHTGRVTEEYRGDVPPLVLPRGTRVRVEGRASRDVSEGGLQADSGAWEMELALDGPVFAGAWVPTRSGTFRWIFRDEVGALAEIVPEPLSLTLLPDSVPRVRITFPGPDTVLPLNLRQPLVIEALDDYGIRSLDLVAYRVTSLGDRQEPVIQSMELGGNRGVLARPLMDVSRWGLLPGDTVRYYARVVDNSPAAQRAETPEHVLRMPSAAELRREAEARLEGIAQEAQDLADRAAETADETRELERQSGAAREQDQGRTPSSRSGRDPDADRAGFEEREELRQALERQEGMQSDVDSIQAQLQELAEAMREAGASDPALAGDLRDLQDLLDQIASPEMRGRMEEMARSLDQMDAGEARESLRDLSQEQDAFRERLEESLERFRRAAVDQDFRATTAESEELAQQERALADAMREEEHPESRAGQQEQLESRTEGMEERMRRLEDRLQQLGEQEAARDVRSAREQSTEARDAMAQAGQEARQNQGQEAGERADEAADRLERAAEELEQAQDQMAQQQSDAVRQALQEASDDALSLARRQSDLREEMEGASQERLGELRGDEAALAEGVRNMAENVADASQMAGGNDRELSERMGQAMAALQQTVAALESRTGPTPSPMAAAELAVDALNQVALMAMAGAQAAEQGAQGQSSGEQDVQEQLESLAQQQGQVNNQASQVMPMQLGQKAMEAQMEQLAQEQQSVASDLDELSDGPGKEGQSLADLEALAEEARQLAEALAEGRLDAGTRERQERLFHRLLDAGRTMENEELSDERESQNPGAFRRQDIAPLGPDALNALRFRLPTAEALQRLAPAERRLVLQYFERLNQAAGGGGAGGGGAW